MPGHKYLSLAMNYRKNGLITHLPFLIVLRYLRIVYGRRQLLQV
jgi:hypothetical protein